MRPDTYGRIAERADLQLGLVNWSNLRSIDVRADSFRRQVDRGEWLPWCDHVFRHRFARRSWHQDVLAALLDARDGAVATGVTAARLWEIPGYDRARELHVLAKRGGSHRLCRGTLHETFWLPDHHRTTRGVIPVVTVDRLPMELAWHEPMHRLRWIVDFAMNELGLTADALALVGAELCRRGKPGSRKMRLLVDEVVPGYVPPATILEARFRDLCLAAGLPTGIRQHNTGGDEWIGRIDVAFPEHKLLVELDSRRWHNARAQFELDRERSNALVLEGWRVIRITWRMLHDEPERVVRLLRSLLK